MREILFRGKNEADVWHYGAYLPYESGEVAILESFSKYGYEAVELSQRCKVIPETVGQYIGANDKNHKEIFEGDIVKSCDNCIYEIRWDNQRAMFYLKNDITHMSADFYHYFASDLEIIGNIHDNPELLKGGAVNE